MPVSWVSAWCFGLVGAPEGTARFIRDEHWPELARRSVGTERRLEFGPIDAMTGRGRGDSEVAPPSQLHSSAWGQLRDLDIYS